MGKVASVRGFTLIELAIVLVIVALLLGTLLVPVTSLVERARLKQATAELDGDMTDALIGYAASRPGGPYLPCPDCRRGACPGGTPNDGVEDRDGGQCSVSVGNWPWVSLGTAEHDPWHARYAYQVHPQFADAGLPFGLTTPDLGRDDSEASVVDDNGDALVGSASLAAGPEGAVAIVISHGRNRFGALSVHGVLQPDPPADPGGRYAHEWENLDGDALYIAGPVTRLERGAPREFDDQLAWLSAMRLRGMLMRAGVL